VAQWRQELVTQELLKRAQNEFNRIVADIVDGVLLDCTADQTAMKAAEFYGHMQGLKHFLDFKGDDPKPVEAEEEDKPQENRSFTWTEA
jgi:hypothetical protein